MCANPAPDCVVDGTAFGDFVAHLAACYTRLSEGAAAAAPAAAAATGAFEEGSGGDGAAAKEEQQLLPPRPLPRPAVEPCEDRIAFDMRAGMPPESAARSYKGNGAASSRGLTAEESHHLSSEAKLGHCHKTVIPQSHSAPTATMPPPPPLGGPQASAPRSDGTSTATSCATRGASKSSIGAPAPHQHSPPPSSSALPVLHGIWQRGARQPGAACRLAGKPAEASPKSLPSAAAGGDARRPRSMVSPLGGVTGFMTLGRIVRMALRGAADPSSGAQKKPGRQQQHQGGWQRCRRPPLVSPFSGAAGGPAGILGPGTTHMCRLAFTPAELRRLKEEAIRSAKEVPGGFPDDCSTSDR